MKCERCGKNMTYTDSALSVDVATHSIVGTSIIIRCETENKETIERFKEQLGKYSLNKEYNFCFECWLDSLMGVQNVSNATNNTQR